MAATDAAAQANAHTCYTAKNWDRVLPGARGGLQAAASQGSERSVFSFVWVSKALAGHSPPLLLLPRAGSIVCCLPGRLPECSPQTRLAVFTSSLYHT